MTDLQPCVVITGAGRGLGAALALRYAAAGSPLALCARTLGPVSSVAERCRALGADARAEAVDVTDVRAVARWLQRADAWRPLDLLIVNAGIFTGRPEARADESLDDAIATLRVNLEGAVATAHAAIPLMRERRRGRIAFVSSLAAMHPLADAPAYSASKAAVSAYAAALREALRADGVGVTDIRPGHIATDQTRRQAGRLPLIMSPDAAAARIKRGLDRSDDVIAFPARLAWLIRAGKLLPLRWRAKADAPFRFHVREG
ncbi:MAG: SDR family NAD(P)-dependent oxidoreductase [Hyphomicrobiales bacterium]|nr:SDR family NAD(P)-dependent oxidoreductase [Hyphomicrobiales bacterium]